MRASTSVAVALLAAASATLAEDAGADYSFMPPGGRTVLVEHLAAAGGEPLQEVLARSRDRAEWAAWAIDRDPALGEVEAATFAAYAALNLPLASETLAAIFGEKGMEGLPADGKDLAIAQCQFCHGLYSGYLSHDRDETAWRGVFKAPFHAEIPMSETERDEFAAYSAINMPVALEDVPPDLRF